MGMILLHSWFAGGDRNRYEQGRNRYKQGRNRYKQGRNRYQQTGTVITIIT